jgi:hypothetical protein
LQNALPRPFDQRAHLQRARGRVVKSSRVQSRRHHRVIIIIIDELLLSLSFLPFPL